MRVNYNRRLVYILRRFILSLNEVGNVIFPRYTLSAQCVCSARNAIGRSLPDAEEYLFCAQDELSRRSTPFYGYRLSHSLRSLARSLDDLFLLFLFLSGRSRTSRLSLLHLFIGPLYYLQFGARSREGNFILVFCPVALRPPSHRFFTSALALLLFFFIFLLYLSFPSSSSCSSSPTPLLPL